MMDSKETTIVKRGRPRKGSANALKHGMMAKVPLLPGESERPFIELREGLVASLNPVGRVEEELVARVAGVMWRLRRIGFIEAEILKGLSGESEIRQKETRVEWLSKMVSDEIVNVHAQYRNPKAYSERKELMEEIRELRKVEREPSVGRGMLMEQTDRSFGLLRRYESRLERSMYLALRQLSELQAVRQAKEREMARVHRLPQKVTLVTGGELREREWTPHD